MSKNYKIFVGTTIITALFFIFAIQKSLAATVDFTILNPIGINNFQDLINLIGVWIFNLSIPIAVIIIIYAGILMLTAGGNPGKFKKGAEALKYAVIGLAIIFIGKGFVTLIQSILNLKNG